MCRPLLLGLILASVISAQSVPIFGPTPGTPIGEGYTAPITTAVETFNGYMPFPGSPIGFTTSPSFETTALAISANLKAGFIFPCPFTGSIDKVAWGVRTTTTGADATITLETQDPDTGFPSGTLLATDTSAVQTIADEDDNVTFLTTLTADAPCTKGDIITFTVGFPDMSAGVTQIAAYADEDLTGLPTSALFNVSWARVLAIPAIALEYTDGTYHPIPGVLPLAGTVTSTVFSTATTPESIGLRFQFPFPVSVCGWIDWLDSDNDYTVKLVTSAYNQSTEAGLLLSQPVDAQADAAADRTVEQHLFPSCATLEANTYYRLIYEPTTASNNIAYDYTVTSLAAMGASPGGSAFHLTTAKDPTGDGDWTNYNNVTDGFRKPFIYLLLGGFLAEQ